MNDVSINIEVIFADFLTPYFTGTVSIAYVLSPMKSSKSLVIERPNPNMSKNTRMYIGIGFVGINAQPAKGKIKPYRMVTVRLLIKNLFNSKA